MKFGFNAGAWSDATAAGITPSVYRAYNTPQSGTHGVPATWTRTSNGTMPSGVIGMISFEPDPQMLLAGELDELIKMWLAQAPAGSYPVCYHECDQGPDKGKPDAPTCKLIQRYFYDLVKPWRPDLIVGQITMAYTAWNRNNLAAWIEPGLDYQGIDVYKPLPTSSSAPAKTVKTLADPWLSQLRKVDPKVAIAVTETNCYAGSARPTWFKNIRQWCINHNGVVFSPFFGDKYPWDVTDALTINELRGFSAA